MNERVISLKSVIAPHFYPVHNAMRFNPEISSFWLKGGRGSTKSSFAAIQIILGIMEDPNANCLACRKVGNTVRKSLMETFLWAIDILGVNHLFSRTVAPSEITYLPTGQQIVMTGLDDPLKLKSIKIKKGYFKYLWFEEAPEFNGMEEIRNVAQSAMRGGDKFIEIITYNPPNDPAAWVNVESEREVEGRLVHSSTYLDVPPEWLGTEFIKRAEQLKSHDYLKYEHEYLGKSVGRAEQIVYHGKWEIKDFETPPVTKTYQGRFFFGADFGFANDASTLVRCFIMESGGALDLYIDYEVGGVGVEMEELGPLYSRIPESKRWLIYGDCARPETISYISRRGFNIEPSPKWQGSVEDGIEFIRSFNRIYIHPRCERTTAEIKTYSYKVDRLTQKILPVIAPNQDDHYLDALRYALSEYVTAGVSILDVI